MRAFRAAILSLFIATALASGPPASAEERVSSINCSTPLRLYDGTFRTGASVSVYTRGLWVNLSVVDFNNKTSSYAVGACAVVLAAGTNGSGAHYPECLEAGCIENTMLSGWNNVISSVYLR